MTDKEFFRKLILQMCNETPGIGRFGGENDIPFCVKKAKEIYEAAIAIEKEVGMDSIFISGEDLLRKLKEKQSRIHYETPTDRT